MPYNCTSPQTFHWLLPAGWKFTVVGTDAAGNAAPAQVREWAVAFEAGKQYTRLYRYVGPSWGDWVQGCSLWWQQCCPVECACQTCLCSGPAWQGSLQGHASILAPCDCFC